MRSCWSKPPGVHRKHDAKWPTLDDRHGTCKEKYQNSTYWNLACFIYCCVSYIRVLLIRHILVLCNANDNLADVLLALEVLVCGKGVLKLEHPIDDGVDLVRRECAVQVIEPAPLSAHI